MEERSDSPRDITKKEGISQVSTSSGRSGMERMTQLIKDSLHIDTKKLYEKTLGEDYGNRLNKQERLAAIKERFDSAQSYIQDNRDHVRETTNQQQFDDLVQQAVAGKKAAEASKIGSTKEQRYTGEHEYRDATLALEAMAERLKEGLKHQAEEDFRQLIHSPEIDATRIAGNLEQILNDRIKKETIKSIIRTFGKCIQGPKVLNTVYEFIEDYYNCKGEFQRNEANLSFEQANDMRAKITEGYRRVAALTRNEQFPQGNLRDFANEQVKKLNEAIESSKSDYSQIYKAKEVKNQVELEYLMSWIKQMEGVHTSINKRAVVFKDDSQSFFKDASNLTLTELKISLKGFLWSQLDPWRSDAAAFNKVHSPTLAPRDETAFDDYHGDKVSDPYRPLEKLEDKITIQYMEKEGERFKKYIASVDGKNDLTAYWKDIWDYPRESIPARFGDTHFSFYRDGKSPQPVYRIRDTLEGEPHTLINPNDPNDPVFSSKDTRFREVYPSPDGKFVAYMTSKGGGAEGTIHIRNVATREDLPNVIEKCNSAQGGGISWDRNSEGFQYRYPASDDLSRFVLKHFDLNTPEQTPTVFELQKEGAWLGGYYLRDQSGEWGNYDFVSAYVNNNYSIYIKPHGPDGSYELLFTSDKAEELDLVAEVNGRIYAVTDLGAPRKRLVAIDPNNSQPAHWETILSEHDQDIMQWVKVHQKHLIAGYTHDIADKVTLHNVDGAFQCQVPLPEQSTMAFGEMNKGDTAPLLMTSGYRSPGDMYKYHIDENRLEKWKESESKVNLQDAIVERIYSGR